MQLGIFKNEEAVADAAADILTTSFQRNIKKVLGVATGSTPLPLYERLRAMHRDGTFSLDDFQAFALDEYVGISPDHPQAYRNVLRTELVGDDKTGLREENLFTPNGQADDPQAAAKEYDERINEVGGVTLQILGVGTDGHIGFNEPGVSLMSHTHVDTLAQSTRRDNARFFDNDLDQVPTRCLTQGLGTIMEAQNILLIATGEAKADAVKQLMEGAVSTNWPVTILQMHNHAWAVVDEAAASKLEHPDIYRNRWEQLV